ncbi:MAG: hypothetical protein M1821_009104 [Bathelium mastoideum]|nr:MAG: hypothetical protein M1821_009104 [Bathelium mastoideum]
MTSIEESWRVPLALFTPASTTDTITLIILLCLSVVWHTRRWTWDKPNPYSYVWYERPQMKDGGGSACEKQSRDIAESLVRAGKRIVIFWGSQSGTSERLAYRLGRDLRLRLGLESLTVDLSDYDAETIARLSNDHIAIFLLSTYGEGDPSDNAVGLWDWLKKLDVPLHSLNYLLFGLGNSNYVHYNRVADVVHSALENAGAQQLLDIGRADDAHGATDEHFLRWKEDVICFLKQRLNLEEVEQEETPTFSITEIESSNTQAVNLGQPVASQIRSIGRSALCSPTKPLPVVAARELFDDSQGRNCLHLEVNLSEHPEIVYKTGDHLGVWPMNPDREIDRLVNTLALMDTRHTPISITSDDPSVKIDIPSPTTPDALFRHYLEICGAVPRDTVQNLVALAPTPTAKAFLHSLAKDRPNYARLAARKYLTLGRILELASAADGSNKAWAPKLTLAHVLDVLPRTQPRYYSISSSSVTSPRLAHLTLLVAPTVLTELDETIPGLTTTYLQNLTRSRLQLQNKDQSKGSELSFQMDGPANLLAGGKIFAFTRRSKFKLPTQSTTALIMVAAGTGIAPFRAFLYERCRLKEMGREVGDMILFFGCQHPNRDFIYRDELIELERKLEGRLHIMIAFSRVVSGTKVYVQHKLCEHGDEVTKMLDDGASLYICGRSSMAREVTVAARSAFSKHRKTSAEEAEEYVNRLKRTHRWQEDVWG